ncbi:hypothetical protein V496_06957 [Pseudogymnoascus sp. VKM F-4515 (FW-2607)]|nr:hypothetical protein V496_06957 [Pseudogymnoascus sp. VKM F-4515 (FW-2607)]KFY97257.1 hypothetical protein V498_02162 [Pseudogymnoascus sp. VKM F-4517 (FW-2822)]
MSSSLSFYGGWAGIAVVGAGYWYLQNRKPAVKQTKAAPPKQATKQTEARKDTKAKKQRSDGAQSSGDQASEKSTNKKARKAVKIDAKPAVQNVTPQPTTSTNDDDDDEIDNREFARQLSNAKAGTAIGSKPQAGARQKSVKQSRAQAAASNSFDDNTASASSSNAGADADDDLSAANSPVSNARSSNLGGVGDMLEPASQGPSVLRITSPVNPQPKKEKKAAKAPEPVETKKQRQNRKKREAEKLALQESEQDRKVLQESQRRTAREAEGRAAKDGSQYTNAAAASVWKGEKAAETKPTNGQVELLDTYEPATKPAATKPKAKESNDYATLPSEEEQLRLIEEDSAWNTVTKPKKGKKKADEAVKPVEAPTPAPYVPETKLPKQRTVEAIWAENNDHGVATYDLTDEYWEVA